MSEMKNTNDCMIDTVEAAGFTMDYARFGEGKRAMVILPGISMNPVPSYAGAVARRFGVFGKTHTVYLFDRKRDIRSEYTVNDMMEDTVEAMKILGVKDADVYGASQGAQIGLRMAEAHPGMVHKLLLASTTARPDETAVLALNRWREAVREGNIQKLNHDMFCSIYSEETLQSMKDILPHLEQKGTMQDCERLLYLASNLETFDCYDQLDKIKCPALVVGSYQDKVFTSKGIMEVAEKLRCQFHMYERYGHAVYDEAPDFLDRMAAFFA